MNASTGPQSSFLPKKINAFPIVKKRSVGTLEALFISLEIMCIESRIRAKTPLPLLCMHTCPQWRKISTESEMAYCICFSKKYQKDEIRRMVIGEGGYVAYLGTNDSKEVEERAKVGDGLRAIARSTYQ